ncbi:MAG: pyridoxal-phosphate dependent enzyme [Burkholderiaceae bacterium]|nr:pyridoxal-phosphate dependent enzyme [Burkholderiaceae bacterium]
MTVLHHTTPLIEHAALSAQLDKRIFLKLENLQASGSFKLRGIGKLCQNAHARGARRLVCPSGGNAGFAAAVAGKALGMTTQIVVPATTPESVRARIRTLGAEVVVSGGVWDEANQEALRLCSEPGSVYVPPFDHPDIWDGNASLIDEAARQIEGGAFDVVVCAVGGGGLMAGVLHGLHRNGLQHVPVIAAETEGAASFAAAIEAGEPVTLPAITSIAGSLGAKRVAEEAYEWTRRHEIRSAVVTDADTVDACLRFADEMRMLVEPACGAALAVAYGRLPQLAPFKRPLIVVCGGIGVDLGKLAAWKTQYGL